jgi:hypothetical protein
MINRSEFIINYSVTPPIEVCSKDGKDEAQWLLDWATLLAEAGYGAEDLEAFQCFKDNPHFLMVPENVLLDVLTSITGMPLEAPLAQLTQFCVDRKIGRRQWQIEAAIFQGQEEPNVIEGLEVLKYAGNIDQDLIGVDAPDGTWICCSEYDLSLEEAMAFPEVRLLFLDQLHAAEPMDWSEFPEDQAVAEKLALKVPTVRFILDNMPSVQALLVEFHDALISDYYVGEDGKICPEFGDRLHDALFTMERFLQDKPLRLTAEEHANIHAGWVRDEYEGRGKCHGPRQDLEDFLKEPGVEIQWGRSDYPGVAWATFPEGKARWLVLTPADADGNREVVLRATGWSREAA